jgi:superfamily II DNA helicase RecQ
LEQAGIPSLPYNAKMTPKQRTDVEMRWRSGDVRVIVATIAFGMGIDCCDVRMVVHWNLPKSLAAYYQEAGRAGRDGAKALCLLFVDMDEIHRAKFVVSQSIQKQVADHDSRASSSRDTSSSPDPRTPEGRLQKEYNAMVKYCTLAQCRRNQIAAHFGERCANFSHESCRGLSANKCDVCRDPQKMNGFIQGMATYASTPYPARHIAVNMHDNSVGTLHIEKKPALRGTSRIGSTSSSATSIVAQMRARLADKRSTRPPSLVTGAISPHHDSSQESVVDRRNGSWWEGAGSSSRTLGVRRKRSH